MNGKTLIAAALWILQFSGIPSHAGTYTYTILDFPGLTNTVTRSLNNAGQVAGSAFSFNISGGSSFVYSGGAYTPFNLPNGLNGGPNDINDAGQIVGVFVDGGNNNGFLKNGDAFTVLNFPGATNTIATGLNNTGQIIGVAWTNSAATTNFVYSGGTFAPLNLPYPGGPNGINDAGQIVGVFVDSGHNHGFLKTGDVYTILDFPGATDTIAKDINNLGQVVGYYWNNQSDLFSFIYTDGVYTTFDLPPGLKGGADAINDAGQVVGVVVIDGNNKGFLATPISETPLPGAIPLFATGLGALGLITYRRKRKQAA